MATKKKKGQKPKNNKEQKKQTKSVKKSTTKSSKATKNSVSKANSTSVQRRTYSKLPKGYKATKNARVKDGVIEINNGKPLFKTNKNGQRQIATDRNGNPAYKEANLIVNPQAHKNSKKKR